MNTQHCLDKGTGASFEAVRTSKAILYWKIAFLTGDISVSNKDSICGLPFKACWVNFMRASVCYDVPQANRGKKDSSQVIVSVGNRMCSPGLEKSEAGSSGNRAW